VIKVRWVRNAAQRDTEKFIENSGSKVFVRQQSGRGKIKGNLMPIGSEAVEPNLTFMILHVL